MARQDGRPVIHFAPDDVALCVIGRRTGVEAQTSSDPRETTCGQCHRLPAWRQAWRDEARKVKAP